MVDDYALCRWPEHAVPVLRSFLEARVMMVMKQRVMEQHPGYYLRHVLVGGLISQTE